MIKKSLCAVALLAAALPAVADEFTYLSGGMLFNKHGFSSEINKTLDETLAELNNPSQTIKNKVASRKLKASGVGLYLNGSVGFDNNVFVEGRLQNSNQISNYLLGVGYHYPVMQQVDIYGLVGVSKRHMQFINDFSQEKKDDKGNVVKDSNGGVVYEKQDHFSKNYSDNFRPTAEIGIKARITDEAGVTVAYRFAQFGKVKHFETSKDHKVRNQLHEGRISGYYKIADNLAIEAGYSYTASLKGMFKDAKNKDDKGKMLTDHVGQIGLRYAF